LPYCDSPDYLKCEVSSINKHYCPLELHNYTRKTPKQVKNTSKIAVFEELNQSRDNHHVVCDGKNQRKK